MNFAYIAALFVLCIIYALVFYLLKYFHKRRISEIVFTLLVFVPYVCLSLIVLSDVGFDDWNFRNTLPVANVSPFMFALMPIVFCLPRSLKKHFLLLISLLSVGMAFSSVLGCVNNAAINYKFHLHFMLDYISHFAISLYGVYIVRTRQVKLTVKNSAISASIIVLVAFIMMGLNVMFDTAFFGLSLNGKHNIYNNVLFKSSYLSAFVYIIGLIIVLLLGYLYMMLVLKRSSEIALKSGKNKKTRMP